MLQYPHSPALGYGDAIAGGFVYRGTRVPLLQGKFVFGDITTGQLFYADLAALSAADDGNPATLAPFHRIELLWDNPRNTAGVERFDRMYEIVASEYRARGGSDADLPGSATVSDLTGGGRADIRLACDAAGEIYILSKSDGMIRAVGPAPAATVAPTIARQPEPHTIAVGGTVVFSAEADANAAAYQWKHNGTAIAGAISPIYVLANATLSNAGNYTVEVSNSAGTTPSAGAPLTVGSTFEPGRIANFSIRSNAGAGGQTLTVGLAIDGPANAAGQTLLIRGVGPTLASLGVATVLADPKLELFRGATRIVENDNWDASSTIASVATQVSAFALPAGSQDAATLQTALPNGAYTVQISSAAAGQSGTALAEIFDASPPAAGARQLVNVSARTQVAGADNPLIAGFVIGGITARTVLIRAAGPALSRFGVAGVLADPTLALFRGNVRVAVSDDWESSAEIVNAFTTAGAFNFNARSRDAVLLLTLAPGAYTAHVSGAIASATGIALVEIYVLP